MKNKQGVRGARRLLACQTGLTLILAIASAVFGGWVAAQSAALGGLVSIIPNAYFAWKVFQYQGARAARKIVNSLYQGEAIKIFLTLVLFALVFVLFSVKPLLFFMTYIVVQMVFWFAPLIFDNKHNRPESD
ncbi:F0F1 ATP synthase subunit I [Legionella impletisoli]|uniref:ATP synthase subunit I n=1 Tax=Legionella impletisoli TaxID=343510 RepID=A0A917JVI4_9GAMM|nr:F0F1 ATP synthase subunit I [Legionella impletisoli]GGI86663.1 ATP synthase subunit I [Legionella impletisoli]